VGASLLFPLTSVMNEMDGLSIEGVREALYIVVEEE